MSDVSDLNLRKFSLKAPHLINPGPNTSTVSATSITANPAPVDAAPFVEVTTLSASAHTAANPPSAAETAPPSAESLQESPHLSEAAMREHLNSGRALPLFPPAEVPNGPVQFAGQWWAVLKSAPQLGYTLVDNPAMVSALNDTAHRLYATV